MNSRFDKKHFLNKTEIIVFFAVFIVLLYVFFPKNIINNFLKKDYNDPAIKIKYLKTMLQAKDNKNLKLELIKSYLKLNKFNEALKVLNTLKLDKKLLLLKADILEKQYFSTKNNKPILKELNSTLFQLASYNDYNFLYKKANELNLLDLKILSLKHLNKIDKLIDIYTWKKNNKELLKILQDNINKNLSQKLYLKLLNTSIYLKNKKYMKYYLSKLNSKTISQKPLFVANLYMFFHNPKKAYNIIKKYSHSKKEIAKYALWAKDFNTAFKYHQYLPQTQKTTYQLALALNKYETQEQILMKEVENKKFNKINDLKFVFIKTFHLQKGIKFFTKMYNKYKKDDFLFALFYLYDTLGDIDGIKKVAKLLNNKITPYIALKVANIYLGERKPQKGYEYLLKAYQNDKTNSVLNHTLYNFAIITHHKKIAFEVLKQTASTPLEIMNLSLYYKNKNPKKAFEILNKHKQFLSNIYYFFNYLNIAFLNHKYHTIINLAKKEKNLDILNNPSFWYLYATSYEKLGDIQNAKKVYLQSLKYLKTNPSFYWFLINHKDKQIKLYLNQINDKKLLLSSYILLKQYNKALIIVKQLLSNHPNDLDLLLTYYSLLENLHKNNTKLRFKIYKLAKKAFKTNKSEKIFRIYFQFGLYYETYDKMKHLLNYAKKFKDYSQYQILFYTYYGEYNKLEQLERR